MRTLLSISVAVLLTGVLAPTASADMAAVCTPDTMPVGACASAEVGSKTVYYTDPSVGETWSHTCTPWSLVCVLTPDTVLERKSTSIPWLDTSGTYVWCHRCAELVDLPAVQILA